MKKLLSVLLTVSMVGAPILSSNCFAMKQYSKSGKLLVSTSKATTIDNAINNMVKVIVTVKTKTLAEKFNNFIDEGKDEEIKNNLKDLWRIEFDNDNELESFKTKFKEAYNKLFGGTANDDSESTLDYEIGSVSEESESIVEDEFREASEPVVNNNVNKIYQSAYCENNQKEKALNTNASKKEEVSNTNASKKEEVSNTNAGKKEEASNANIGKKEEVSNTSADKKEESLGNKTENKSEAVIEVDKNESKKNGRTMVKIIVGGTVVAVISLAAWVAYDMYANNTTLSESAKNVGDVISSYAKYGCECSAEYANSLVGYAKNFLNKACSYFYKSNPEVVETIVPDLPLDYVEDNLVNATEEIALNATEKLVANNVNLVNSTNVTDSVNASNSSSGASLVGTIGAIGSAGIAAAKNVGHVLAAHNTVVSVAVSLAVTYLAVIFGM